jgi:Mrp family chromosome partitioning ATPase
VSFCISDRNEEAHVQGAELNVVCDGLLSRIFQRPSEENSRGFVVAITSTHPKAGVSHITNALASALDQGGDQFTMLLNGRYMSTGDDASGDSGRRSGRRASTNLWQRHKPDGSFDNWHDMHSRLAIYLEKLRREYRYILIDCPSLREAEHAVILAPLVDGVVLVVEANRTQKDQFLYAERTIENAGGRILGHVLNKRSYVIPEWLHRRMEAVGI